VAVPGNERSPPEEPLGRRRFVRLPVSLPVVGHAAPFAGGELRGGVRDISTGGLMAEFPVYVLPGSDVDLTLQTRRGSVGVQGRVVWAAPVESWTRHGIEFSEPKGKDFARDLFLNESR